MLLLTRLLLMRLKVCLYWITWCPLSTVKTHFHWLQFCCFWVPSVLTKDRAEPWLVKCFDSNQMGLFHKYQTLKKCLKHHVDSLNFIEILMKLCHKLTKSYRRFLTGRYAVLKWAGHTERVRLEVYEVCPNSQKNKEKLKVRTQYLCSQLHI